MPQRDILVDLRKILQTIVVVLLKHGRVQAWNPEEGAINAPRPPAQRTRGGIEFTGCSGAPCGTPRPIRQARCPCTNASLFLEPR